MSSAKALSFYNALTPQQKHFVDQKTLSTTLSVKQWLSFLSKASAYDDFGEKALKGIKKRILIFSLLTVIASIPVFTFPSVYTAILPAVGLVLVAFQVLDLRKFKGRDISDYLRLFFIPFLEVMKIKAGEDAKLSAALDFRDPLKALTPEKYVDKTAIKKNIKLFEPKILLGKVTLSDGVYLETVLVDEIRKISYWKRGSSGKSKHKSKVKTTHNYFIKLTVPKEHYKLKTNRNAKFMEVSESESEIIIKYKGKHKVLGTSIMPVSTFFSALQSMYSFYLQAGGETSETEQPFIESSPSTVGIAAAAIPAAIWTGSYFSNYDYDSTTYQSDPDLILNDDQSSTNIFDS